MRFVWFWTFWHWSKESFRDGLLLRSPLQGVGSHWDEWFRHEASANDLRAIEAIGRTESAQRQFIAWIYRHWTREMDWRGNRVIPKYVLNQLAHLPPFCNWKAFEAYRTNENLRGISAVVLSEGSDGNSADVRQVVAVALPEPQKANVPNIAAEDFHAEQADLDTALRAAMSLLRGRGLITFLALWIAGGKRPYPRWLRITLCAGWLAAGGAILYLLFGPDPDEQLLGIVAALTGLFAALVLVSAVTIGAQAWRAWRVGKHWSVELNQSVLHLQMAGGLTLRGSSAGLPFSLNTLLSLYRARPQVASRSWLWRGCLHKLNDEIDEWAATGVITPAGFLKPVVLNRKLRACLSHSQIRHILVPGQREGNDQAVRRAAVESNPASARDAKVLPASAAVRLGFAEEPPLQSHRCRHAAQSLLVIGNFFSRRQVIFNLVAISVSILMLAAARDVRSLLWPYPSPEVIPPSSPSRNYLWVSIDTQHPEYFGVTLESGFWTNRRAGVARYSGANASVRAELPLRKFSGKTSGTEKMATIWVERRRYFLWREFLPGERVGRYTLPYLLTFGYQ